MFLVRADRDVLVKEGRIAAIAERGTLPETPLAITGRLLPSLTDGHGHLGLLADSYRFVNVHEARSEDEAIDILRAHAGGNWLIGRDFDQNLWREPSLPSSTKLSRAFPTQPVFVRRVDHHAAWINHAALTALGATFISRHPHAWINDGILLEGAADDALAQIPRPPQAVHTQNVARAAATLRAAGYTGVHDMATRAWDLAAFEALALPLRVHCYLYDDDPAAYDHWLDALPQARHVHVAGVKIFLDGALGSRGARLKKSYSDCPNHFGHDTFPIKRAEEIVTRAFSRGLRVALHAIGDAAVHDAVTLIAAAAEKTGASPALARIEHAQVIADADLQTIAKLGVPVGVQFVHHRDDAPWLKARLGQERLCLESRWRSLKNAGVSLLGGSDFPIASFALADALAAAADHENESLTKAEVFEAFTSAAAKAVGAPFFKVGAPADLTLWDDDAGTRPIMSWLNGQP